MGTKVHSRLYKLPLGFRFCLCRQGEEFNKYFHPLAILFRLLDIFFWTVAEAVKWLIIALFVILYLTQCTSLAHSAPIPKAAQQHRSALIRTAHATWGLDAPIAVFAGQIHAESRWNANAKSPVGAQGLAQFMPATAAWLPSVAPGTGEPLPYNPRWAIHALIAYDLWIWKRVPAANKYNRMAFTLSAYNGGLGWVNRDKKLAARKGLDPLLWFDHVETVNAGRSAANKRENQNYPRIILRDFQWRYVDAGWGPGLAEQE